MTALVWDKPGERVYEAGIDRGVLYLQDGTGVVWNGLTGVEDSSDTELKSYYLDGVKFLENLFPGDFQGKLKAFTYPPEFDSVQGIVDNSGLHFYDQPPKSFNLSYRTKVGSDLDELGSHYKIHILYNIFANPDPVNYATVGSSAEAIEFSWSLTGTPPPLPDFRPTVHIVLDSEETPPAIMALLEAQLYGSSTSDASLPSIQEIYEYFGYLGALIIVDHGDGTWSAIDESDTYITMLDDTTFEIDNADATYLDPNTYTIQTTNPA